jgi:hypothetical protein
VSPPTYTSEGPFVQGPLPPSWPWPVRTPSRPTAATVLLAVGGAVAAYYAGFVVLVSLPIFAGCFGTASCPRPAELVLLLYWALVGLVTATAVAAIVSAVVLHARPARHQVVGWTSVALSIASVAALGVVFPAAFVWLVLLFGGWSLFAILLGGLLAVAWRPT